jgi:2-oxoglutarate dehydrogenase E2 component (dihydrolipoamide succinyltransferase)
MPIIDIKMPAVGDSITEATLIRWTKNDGEAVGMDEPIAEFETDKSNVDVPSTAAGVIKTSVKPGTVVKIGSVIAQIDTDAKASATAKTAAPAAAPSAPKTAAPSAPATPVAKASPEDLSPAPRRAAAELGVDTSKIEGSGKGGRVTKEDVERAASTKSASNNSAAAPSASVAPPAAPSKPASAPPAPVKVNAVEGTRRTPMSKIRKRIAETLVKVKQQTAMLTTFNEVDMSAVMALRSKYKEGFEKKHGIGLGFMSFFVKACAIALREFEKVNGQIDGDDIVTFDHVHMGVAVSTERGLLVPVLKHADKMSFAQIESEIKRLALGARDGKLAPDELSGGTFTITNGGVFGSLLSTPIINGNQSAILGMHTIQQRPVAVGDKVEVHPMMYLALSYDHRIIDGKDSVSFLVRVKNLLEDPSRLLLDV